eukprot:scaffold212_cov173-Amphora_coffeaeformis.AAC.21
MTNSRQRSPPKPPVGYVAKNKSVDAGRTPCDGHGAGNLTRKNSNGTTLIRESEREHRQAGDGDSHHLFSQGTRRRRAGLTKGLVDRRRTVLHWSLIIL